MSHNLQRKSWLLGRLYVPEGFPRMNESFQGYKRDSRNIAMRDEIETVSRNSILDANSSALL